jgi:hypothetical protein
LNTDVFTSSSAQKRSCAAASFTEAPARNALNIAVNSGPAGAAAAFVLAVKDSKTVRTSAYLIEFISSLNFQSFRRHSLRSVIKFPIFPIMHE